MKVGHCHLSNFSNSNDVMLVLTNISQTFYSFSIICTNINHAVLLQLHLFIFIIIVIIIFRIINSDFLSAAMWKILFLFNVPRTYQLFSKLNVKTYSKYGRYSLLLDSFSLSSTVSLKVVRFLSTSSWFLLRVPPNASSFNSVISPSST